MTTQRKLLLNHLKNIGSISGMEALYLYQIRSLPRRIKDLEEHGYVIRRERKQDNTGRAYVRYHLDDPNDFYSEFPWVGTTLPGANLGREYAMELAA